MACVPDGSVVLQLSLGLLAASAGCGRVAGFEAGQGAPVGAWGGPSGQGDFALSGAEETPASRYKEEPGPSRYAASQLASGAGFASETPPGIEFLAWLFDEQAPPLDLDPYIEYLSTMSFAEIVTAALASVRIPLGRNTTAELSVGLSAAGGLEPPWVESPGGAEGGGPGEWPEETPEELKDVFDQLESVFVGLDVPLPARVRSRLAVGLYYGWRAEVDPDAPETEPVTWTLDVKYRAWFW